jgi:hypothetical protein
LGDSSAHKHLTGQWVIQVDYPLNGKVPTKETMESMEAFADIATIAVENRISDDFTRESVFVILLPKAWRATQSGND